MSSTSTPVPFGAAMREQFCLDPEWKNLNHGSYGTYPLPIRAALQSHQHLAESRPDLFIRRTSPALSAESLGQLSSLLNVPASTLAFTKNATTAVATVLHNIPFTDSDVVIYFDTVYGAVEYGLFSLAERSPVQLRKVEYELPITHEEIVKRFRELVQKVKNEEGLNVKAAVFDTVVSMPGVRFPWERLVEACRELGVLSVVDGAHGIGMFEIDLGKVRPDFWGSNLHKWLYVPRGCAVLYVAPEHQHLIRTTLPTSWGYIPASTEPEPARDPETTARAYRNLLQSTATNDDTPYHCVPAALTFRKEVCGGEKHIYSYLETLANQAADSVAATLGTEVLQEPGLKPGEKSLLRACALNNVRLPIAVQTGTNNSGEKEMDWTAAPGTEGSLYAPLPAALAGQVAVWIQGKLLDEYKTFVPVFVYKGWLWTRLSAQVYLELKDFEWVGGVLKELKFVTTYTSSSCQSPIPLHQLLPPPNRLRNHAATPEPSRLLRRGSSDPDHGDDHDENDCVLHPDGDCPPRVWLCPFSPPLERRGAGSGLSGMTAGLFLVPSGSIGLVSGLTSDLIQLEH
ncbi:PLP-dependent transferase [Aspergillus sclerotiicarbonarius CBS 121057]|uniref:PLP-dependent transferase n=1 Tax=Aspergillus sclerotiicarbonarius (strain CBS 121057 / IBT 28362) TaxID=1448318 RepID=A0A319FJ47_ASPSB|nr:PLP-dependent transferase [Aspergillus sclerotiicarbonarius CBS 121057]